MALIKCEECGHDVSDKAPACPNCGCPITKKIICEECGHEIPDKAPNCPKCGTPIQKEKPVPQQEVKPQPKPEPEKPVVKYEEYEADGNKKGFVYVVCGVLAVLLIIGGIVFYNQNESEEVPDTYSGLSFRTFTERKYDSANNVHYQGRLSSGEVANNLRKRGFTLRDLKTESRLDYISGNFYGTTIETYFKTTGGQTTTVELEDNYTEIRFPSRTDVDKFIETVKASGLTETSDGFKDTEEVYWAGTDVSANGTTITLSYK